MTRSGQCDLEQDWSLWPGLVNVTWSKSGQCDLELVWSMWPGVGRVRMTWSGQCELEYTRSLWPGLVNVTWSKSGHCDLELVWSVWPGLVSVTWSGQCDLVWLMWPGIDLVSVTWSRFGQWQRWWFNQMMVTLWILLSKSQCKEAKHLCSGVRWWTRSAGDVLQLEWMLWVSFSDLTLLVGWQEL